jgi:hypothetical protein
VAYRFDVTVYDRPEISGVLDLEQNYREGDRFRLDGVPVEVVLRADDAGDQVDHPVLQCRVLPE